MLYALQSATGASGLYSQGVTAAVLAQPLLMPLKTEERRLCRNTDVTHRSGGSSHSNTAIDLHQVQKV